MSNPERIEISVQSVFQMFGREDDQTMMYYDFMRLLGFAFTELGITRPVEQSQVQSFLAKFGLDNKEQITIQDFIDHEFLVFIHPSIAPPETSYVKIPIQPFVAQLTALGEQIIHRDHIREFLASINEILQVPKPVEESDVSKFIADFERNNDGILQRQDLESIDCLKFMVRKCRRYE